MVEVLFDKGADMVKILLPCAMSSGHEALGEAAACGRTPDVNYRGLYGRTCHGLWERGQELGQAAAKVKKMMNLPPSAHPLSADSSLFLHTIP